MADFYNGNKLLSLRDAAGRPPELYFCCGNRTAGKTYFFKRWFVRRFLARKEKFVIFVRFLDDIANAAPGFWADIGALEFGKHDMTQRPILHGKAAELLIDKKPCGYVIALNDPERIKRNSALFADAERGFLDEFMSENGKYVPNECVKFNSIRLSIARGGARGVHARRVPVYLCSNNVTLFNPYFDYLRINTVIQNRTRYLRGDGWVLEQTFNTFAADAIRDNFRTVSSEELEYAAGNEYLLDTNTFVAKMPGAKTCLCRIKYNGKVYGVWGGINSCWYVSGKLKADNTRLLFALDPADHDETSVLITRSHEVFKRLKTAYNNGNVRFDSQGAKNAFIAALSILPQGK